MSTWFIRCLILLIATLAIVHAYPSSMSKHKWLQERLGHHPHAVYETSLDNVDGELIENDEFPAWLYRSRKFCCAPPL